MFIIAYYLYNCGCSTDKNHNFRYLSTVSIMWYVVFIKIMLVPLVYEERQRKRLEGLLSSFFLSIATCGLAVLCQLFTPFSLVLLFSNMAVSVLVHILHLSNLQRINFSFDLYVFLYYLILLNITVTWI